MVSDKETYGDLVANTLEYYRKRTDESKQGVPKLFQRIRDKLNKLKDENKRILVDVENSNSVQTVVMDLEYVHNRWAMGRCDCFYNNQIVKVPYTIHYSDIVSQNTKVKVIAEGDNPIEGIKQV